MGSFGAPVKSGTSELLETSCGYLLEELQMIWDEVGEDQPEREKIHLELEQECLEVYRRKVDRANILRAQLHQELAVSEAELTHLLLLLGERSLPGRPERMSGTLKEQLESITPALKEMQLRKEERVKQFRAVQGQIQKISAQIAGESEYKESSSNVIVNENDLSQKKLEEYQTELQRLLKEKGDRLQKVERYISTIKNLSVTLGMDSSMIITKVHPSLNELSGLSKNISDGILAKLNSTVEFLETEKHTKLEKLHQLGKALTNLWDLMDTPYADRQHFSYVTTYLSFSCAEISDPGSLTIDIIQKAETEVKRLDQLKASKMKELFLRKQMELEEICNKSHMEIPSTMEMEKILDLINSGEIDHADLLKSMDDQILKAEEEALSRKVIMEKVEKWILARDEERWLEEYSRDENRYSVHRGAHKNLRRAERARLMVHKIPALVDQLITKIRNWEEERKKVFLYDEVPLMEMLDEYNELRKLKEDEKQRQRDMKKVQSPMELGQGNPLGSRPSTSSRHLSDMNQNGGYANTCPLNTRLPIGSQQLGSLWNSSPSHEKSSIKSGKKGLPQKFYRRNSFPRHVKDDAVSVVSTFSGPMSP